MWKMLFAIVAGRFLEAAVETRPTFHRTPQLELQLGFHSRHHSRFHKPRGGEKHSCRHLKKEDRLNCERRWDLALLHETATGARKERKHSSVSVFLDHD